MNRLIHKDLSYEVRGVLFDVHNRLGPLLPEKFYREAVAIGLQAKGIGFRVEKQFDVYYRRQQVGLYYVDVWIEGGKIILELKVAPKILPLHRGQAISYLKVTEADLAIVVNFGAASLQDERFPNFVRDKVVNFAWEPCLLETDLPYPDLTNQLLEGCHRVHFTLGPGFLHQVYRRAARIELDYQELSYTYLKKLPITYQGQQIGMQDVRLLAVEGKVLLATVAVREIDEVIKAQMQSRLKHLGFQLGLLANFHGTTLEVVMVRV